MPRKAKPFLHRGHYITTAGGKPIKLATIEEGIEVAERRLAELMTPKTPSSAMTVGRAVGLWKAHAERYYRGGGEYRAVCYATQPLADRFGDRLAAAVTRAELRELRDHWIAAGYARTTINKYMESVRRAFRWLADEGHVSHDVPDGLTLRALKKGRSAAVERPAVGPVPVETVRSTPLPDPWRTVVLVCWHTGARPGEACGLKLSELRHGNGVWWADKDQHKTRHRGKTRLVPLPEEVMTALAPFIFQAVRAERDNLFVGAYFGRPVKVRDLATAITRGCKRKKLPTWHPNQLRHAFASRTREPLGLDLTRVALGHAKTDMTDHYAKIAEGRIRDVVARLS